MNPPTTPPVSLTPLHLEILLHYNCTHHPHQNYGANAVIEYTQNLVDAGILAMDHPHTGFLLTPRGKAFLTTLLQTPYPTQVWVDANGKVIQ